TPLTRVRMAVDLIADDAENLERHRRRASQLMTRGIDGFGDLLADLLETSRHDAGVADLKPSSIDIRSCIGSVLQRTAHLTKELDVEIIVNLPDYPVNAQADSRRIERVLRNLLANAIDHSEGNPVTIDIGHTETAIAVAVTDQGVGLKEGQE